MPQIRVVVYDAETDEKLKAINLTVTGDIEPIEVAQIITKLIVSELDA